jgi:hypothetical protein
MAEQATFFSPHEPPPDFAAKPSDEALEQRISKLAQFASRNGPSFVELMRTKQANNPEYNFLNDGEGAAYWRWILYCTLYNLPPGAIFTPVEASFPLCSFDGLWQTDWLGAIKRGCAKMYMSGLLNLNRYESEAAHC